MLYTYAYKLQLDISHMIVMCMEFSFLINCGVNMWTLNKKVTEDIM